MRRVGAPTAAVLIAAVLLAGCAGTPKSARPARPDERAQVPALIAQGLASLALSDAEAARRSLTRAVELDPGNASAHVALGRYHAAVRHYRDAKAEFDRAAALDTLSAEPYYRLGLAYAEAGDTKLAVDSFTRALARDPNHVPSQTAMGTVLDSRYLTAGLPAGYGALRTHPSVSRGELGVMLAAELGQDPERPSWRGAKDFPSNTDEARGAWGERWVRAAMARGWIAPFPDGSYHLGDPVTRGALALLIADIEGAAALNRPAGAQSVPDHFPDIGSRHYLLRSARTAVMTGLPLREEGRFEPWASVTGAEALVALQGVARALGVEPVVREEPRQGGMVK